MLNREVLLCIVGLSHSSFAIEPYEKTVVGLGSDSCASFVLALTDNRPTDAMTMGGKTYFTTANAYTQWVTGFVTSANWSGRPGKGQMQIDVNGISLWVKNYCEQNPSQSIVFAASAFVQAHQPKSR